MRAYGDLVDAWEFDNEPDLMFVNENPETYGAFLKACALAITQAREVRLEENREIGKLRKWEMGEREKPENAGNAGERETGGDLAEVVKGGALGAQLQAESRVVLAPLGLPPGPYFEALARNDALRYTEGFNYHFYGYDEDFTGLYRQFEEAVGTALADQAAHWPQGAPAGTALWRSKFYPSADGWSTVVRADFKAPAGDARMDMLRQRRRAREEPPVERSGRWLVTEGVSVEEIPGGWRFRVEGWPATAGGAQRAPVAELPLPVGWRMPAGSLLSLQYRVVAQPGARAASEFSPRSLPALPVALPLPEPFAVVAAPQRVVNWPADWPAREWPVFLSEYGYGSLSKLARNTREGRENQRKFFAGVGPQIRTLGIEGAMAFVLSPYLENDQQEFGLLMDTPLAEADREAEQWGKYWATPALAEVQAQGKEPFPARRWTVRTPPPSTVVIDFVAGKGLGMAKSYGGYFLEGEHGRSMPGEGELVVYQFGADAVTGWLELEGEAWTLPGGASRLALRLSPGERRVIPVEVRPREKRFVASPVTAWFKPGPIPEAPLVAPAAGQAVDSSAIKVGPQARQGATYREAPMPAAGQPVHVFEPYFRTENGNLYDAGSRLVPTEVWQAYFQAAENFGPAFFGRLGFPRRFLDNVPVSLVFHFHPAAFPAVFEVRYAQVAEYVEPERR